MFFGPGRGVAAHFAHLATADTSESRLFEISGKSRALTINLDTSAMELFTFVIQDPDVEGFDLRKLSPLEGKQRIAGSRIYSRRKKPYRMCYVSKARWHRVRNLQPTAMNYLFRRRLLLIDLFDLRMRGLEPER